MEWKEVRLGDIADVQTGPFGSQLHKENYVNKGTPIVTVEHLGNKWFTSQNLPMVSDEDKLRLAKYCSQEGDVIFSRVGSVDRCSYVSKEYCGWLFSGRCLRVRPRSGINPEYLYYFLTNEGTKQYIRNIAVGATMPSINTKLLNEVPITIPSLDDQRRIASILSSLDRKIELNNKINADLEEMAQAIFKNWFVDFEPFKDGKFVDSELGMIPEGWKVGRLDEIADVVGGSTPSKAKPEYYTQKGIAWLTPKDLSNHPAVYSSRGEIDITEEGYNSTSTKLMPKGTVLFTSRAPIGYISIAQNDICTNQGFKSVVPKKAGTCFLYCFLKYVTPEIENKSTGSTFKEASGALMKSLQVIMPEQKVFEEFEAIVSPLFTRIESLEQEFSRLSLLRDTLLPRLMSGELEVPE